MASPALAASKAFNYRFAGKGADAGWYSCEGDVCTYTSVYVADTMYRYDGTKMNGRSLSYSTSTYDPVNFAFSYSYGFVENPTFSISKKLTAASVSASVPITTCSYNEMTGEETCIDGGIVQVNVTWTGIGDLIRGSSKGHYVSKNFTSNYSFKGTWREATAVGLINGNSPGEFGWGQIFDLKDSSMTSCHGSC